jgi:Fic family protein
MWYGLNQGALCMFQPHFRLTPAITKALMAIEACRQAIADLPITVTMLAALRETARMIATHYSTQIEGNRLTLSQVHTVIRGGGPVPGRERDAREVQHYYQVLDEVAALSQQPVALTEGQIQNLHGVVMEGRTRPTSYRDGQNVIRDQSTGRIVYMPPKAPDVPALMADLVQWINQETARQDLPVPIIAALAHYQFATIHPYYDGNGRTARLLTTLILHHYGYGLKGIYALEEYYAQNLQDYYDALAVGVSHNYYLGRAEADVTDFVTYFCTGMAEACAKVRDQAQRLHAQGALDQSPLLRELTAQQRQALSLFVQTKQMTAKELAAFFACSPRAASDLCRRWVQQGFLEVANPSKKARSYQLVPRYEMLIARSLS